jgi:hypothetical protein
VIDRRSFFAADANIAQRLTDIYSAA